MGIFVLFWFICRVIMKFMCKVMRIIRVNFKVVLFVFIGMETGRENMASF